MSLAQRAPWTYTALAALASLALFGSQLMEPITGAVLGLACPFPLLLLYRAHGVKMGRMGLGAALAGGLLLASVQIVAGLYYLLLCIPMTLVMAECSQRGWSDDKCIGLGALAGAALFLAPMVLDLLADGGRAQELWQQQWNALQTAMQQMAEQSGLEGISQEELTGSLQAIGVAIFKLAPGILCAFALLMAWLNMLLTRALARRMNLPPSEALVRWKAPEHLVWGVIAAGGLLVLFDSWPYWLGGNVILVCGTIYFFQGMAIVAFWLAKNSVPMFMRVGIYTLVALVISQTSIMIAALGLFDTWFNFRRPGKNPPV